MKELIDPLTFSRGERLRRLGANTLSVGRAAYAAWMLVRKSPPKPQESAGLLLSDCIDGKLVRGWKTGQRNVITRGGIRLDEQSDKITTALLSARLIRDGNPSYPAPVLAITVVRDIFMQRLRATARANGVDGRARAWGKLKMAVLGLGLVESSFSQAAEKGTAASRIARLTHLAGAALSVYSYFEAKQSYAAQTHARQEASSPQETSLLKTGEPLTAFREAGHPRTESQPLPHTAQRRLLS